MDEATLGRVEKQRLELESNIANLRKSLRHWQTLEIDYESLREEFLGIPEDSSAEDCLKAAQDSKPELLDENELREILTDKDSRPRRPVQLVDLLSKRVDYVVRNVDTIRKQLSVAEKKRNALLLAEEPEHREEAGLPLKEIVEELDDSGQIISSKVQTPGAEASQLLDVLKKAGVSDLDDMSGAVTRSSPTTNHNDDDASDSDGSQAQHEPGMASDLAAGNADEVQEETGPKDQFPMNPADTAEEAKLRREMLDYSRGLDEIGAIVAELELEEDASDVSYDEDDLDLGLDSELDNEDLEEESEDDSGKSKHCLGLSQGYQKRMQELQAKLGLQNVGPQPLGELPSNELPEVPRQPAAEAARQAAITRSEETKTSSLKKNTQKSLKNDDTSKKKPQKKKVAFSSDLDVATQNPMSASKTESLALKNKSSSGPINESVVERNVDQNDADSAAPAAPAPMTPKQSRFKATRQSQPQTPMFAAPMTLPSETTEDQQTAPQPPSKVISSKLVERPAVASTKAPNPDDFSDEAHNREIALDYQQHRMKRIHAQEGGFLGNEDEDDSLQEDEATGRKMSRFKAARIKR